MRKWFWTFSSLTVPAAVVLIGRGSIGAQQPGNPIVEPLQQPAPRFTPAPAAVRTPPPVSPFAVKPDSGAWMICAAHYTGPYAAHLADQVLRQLRERKINCYVFNFADEHRRKENEENKRLLRENPEAGFRPRFTRVEEQCAVLIGGFKDMDTARKALPVVKKLKAPVVRFPNGEEAVDRMVEYGEKTDEEPEKKSFINGFNSTFIPFASKGTKQAVTGSAKINPFERSFVIRNPVASHQKVEMSKRVDPIWKKLNADEPFSLLKCKKNYTILVKCYQGAAAFGQDEKFSQVKGNLGRDRDSSALNGISMQANALAKFLRAYHFEAYVLHTRQGSLVTIGGYNSPDDEEMKLMQQKLGTLKLVPNGGAMQNNVSGGGSLQPTGPASLVPGQESLFELLPNPMPMPIPKL